MMKLETLNGAEVDAKERTAMRRWLHKNKTQLLKAQEEIKKATFHKELEAVFHMWDSSEKYYASWFTCVVTSDGVSIIQRGQGDQSDPLESIGIANVEF